MNNKPTVQLTGVDANAFAVLGVCFRAARKAKWSQEKIDAFRAEATSGDYNDLLQTAMTYFEVT